MAARRGTRVNTGRGNDIVVVNSAPPPARRRRSSSIRRRAPARRRRRRSSSGGGIVAGSYNNRLFGTAAGGFLYGIVEKSFPDIPRMPVIGKSGTVAVACAFLGKSNPYIRTLGVAAAAIAGYSFGKDGAVSGGDFDEAAAIETG